MAYDLSTINPRVDLLTPKKGMHHSCELQEQLSVRLRAKSHSHVVSGGRVINLFAMCGQPSASAFGSQATIERFRMHCKGTAGLTFSRAYSTSWAWAACSSATPASDVGHLVGQPRSLLLQPAAQHQLDSAACRLGSGDRGKDGPQVTGQRECSDFTPKSSNGPFSRPSLLLPQVASRWIALFPTNS